MPKVLIVTYHFPPRTSVGSLRPAGLAKYLPEFGWEPVIVTPAMPGRGERGLQVIETGYRDVLADWKRRLRLNPERGLHDQLSLPVSSKAASSLWHTRLISFATSCLTYPDQTKGWLPFASKAISEFAKSQRVDAIISSAPPVTVHLIAAESRKKLKAPWIADFRDLWVQNLADTRSGLIRRLQGRLEKKTLAVADALVTVSDPWAARLRERYPQKKIATVANGFDSDDFSSPAPPLTRNFSITYTGQLYQGKRDPSSLFETLQSLFAEGTLERSDVRVRFYGPVEPWLLATIEKYGVKDVVDLAGRVGREEALLRQRESQLLLQLGWADPRETGQHTGKLFEYLGSRRPILAVGGIRGVMTELLEETRAGYHPQSGAELRDFLLASYHEFKQNGSVKYRGVEAETQHYTHREMARKMADLLNSLTGKEPATVPNSRLYADPVQS